MDNQKIKLLLIEKLKLNTAYITGDKNHIKIVAIGDIFKNMSQVKRQQKIYKPLIHMIAEQHLHAVSILCYTSKEWEKNNTTMDNTCHDE